MEEKKQIQIGAKSKKLEIAVEEFIKHLESLADTYPLVTAILKGTASSAQRKFNDFLNEECIIKDAEERTFVIPIDKFHKRSILKRRIDNTRLAEDLVPRSFIVSLVSEFDAYIGHIIRVIYYLKPELLNASEKNLSFSKLLELSSIEEAREYLIEKEVESVLRDSHTQHFKWLEGKLDAKLTTDLKSWAPFIELTERRNLFVHNNGVVNNQYLAICRTNNVTLPVNIKVGDTLHVTSTYFHNAYRCVFEIGVKLSQVIWRKFIPDEIFGADSKFVDIIYDQIVRKDYPLAIELAEFSTHKVIKHHNNDIKLTCIINKAQAYKWAGNNDKCREIINSMDWSACSDKFKLVSYTLLDEFESAATIMQRLGPKHDEITKESFRDWPLFKEFRKSDDFLNTYEELFGCKYEESEIEDNLGKHIEEKKSKQLGKEVIAEKKKS